MSRSLGNKVDHGGQVRLQLLHLEDVGGHDEGEDNDEWAIANNYVSVVPCIFDLTGHHAISYLNEEWDL